MYNTVDVAVDMIVFSTNSIPTPDTSLMILRISRLLSFSAGSYTRPGSQRQRRRYCLSTRLASYSSPCSYQRIWQSRLSSASALRYRLRLLLLQLLSTCCRYCVCQRCQRCCEQRSQLLHHTGHVVLSGSLSFQLRATHTI